MVRRSPQEKKELSYAKDRRNTYGENDKSSRKNIPRAKSRANRANRRADAELLGPHGHIDPEQAEAMDVAVVSRRAKVWKKVPDIPLADWIKRQRSRRAARDDS